MKTPLTYCCVLLLTNLVLPLLAQSVEATFDSDIKKMEKAAKHGDGYSAFELGTFYSRGAYTGSGYYGTNPAKAKYWYHKVGPYITTTPYEDSNVTPAYYVAKDYLRPNKEESAPSGETLNDLTMFVTNLQDPHEKDEAEGVFWLQQAADHGDASAMAYLGRCFEEGKGITADPQKALEWYQKSAEHGGAQGLFILGELSFHGKYGLQAQRREIDHYFDLAVIAGKKNPDAFSASIGNYIGDFYLQQVGDVDIAISFYKKEAAAGSTRAMNKLGKIYGTGRGSVAADPELSEQWYALRQATVEADKARSAAIQAETQQDLAQRAQSQPAQPRAASIMNGISAVLQGATDSMAAQQARESSDKDAVTQSQSQLAATYARDQTLKAQQDAEQASLRAQHVAAAINTTNSSGTGRCPNGQYVDEADQCDCRKYSASGYGCFSQRPGGETRQPVHGAIINSGSSSLPATVASGHQASVDNVEPPSTNSNAPTLGTGSPAACAKSPSGSQLPIVPGSIAPSCIPAACRPVNIIVHLESHWTDSSKTKVAGSFSNDSVNDATCTVAFHKNGQWTEYQTGIVKAGAQHVGDGLWSVGTDSSDIKYVCYEGMNPVDIHGSSCNANVHFFGMTTAGSDK